MENKNLKYPIVEYTGGCMYVEPLMVDGASDVKGSIWQIRVTKEIRGLVNEHQDRTYPMNEVRIPVGTYTFTKIGNGESPTYIDDVLLFDMENKQFVFKRFVDEASSHYPVYGPPSYVCIMMSAWYNYDGWANWLLPGVVRCYCYNENAAGKFTLTQCRGRFIDISKIYSPGEYINWGDLKDMYTFSDVLKEVTVFFPEGEYFGDFHYSNIWVDMVHVTIKGAGPDKTVFRYADREGNDLIPTYSEVSNAVFKDIKLVNHSFLQYHLWKNKKKTYLEFYNVHIEWTLNGGWAYVFVLYPENLRFRFIDSKLIVKETHCGIFINGPVDYLIEGSYFYANSWTHAIRIESSHNGVIRRCKVVNGVTGIIHAASKENIIYGATVEDCELEGQIEEGISFDCIGDSNDRVPVICECKVSQVKDRLYGTYREDLDGARYMELQIQDARKLVKTGPDVLEFQNYDLNQNREFLLTRYVVFKPDAGKGFAGTFAKIKDAYMDAIGNFYIVIGKRGGLDNLNLNDYSLVITSGFFHCKVINNIVKDVECTGIALYCSFYGGMMHSNYIQNCGCAYLSGGQMQGCLLTSALGNNVSDNVFMDVKNEKYYSKAIVDSGLGLMNIYTDDKMVNNRIADNLLINSDMYFTNSDTGQAGNNQIIDGKVFRNSGSWSSVSGTTTDRPQGTYTGQTYVNTDTNKLECWNGTAWV